MPNRLARETSPYLLQHQANPVDWYAWGAEAFAAARAQNKPVFLSVGYAACHWCHVMAHESFEDPGTADLLNQHFVAVKVDREERPDVDGIYMDAVVALTGQGGWPMSVFLTPEGEPFHGGTYFPPEPRFGMPSFRQVLQAVADAWRQRPAEMRAGAERLLQALQASTGQTRAEAFQPAALDEAARTLANSHDGQHGGWGTAPKFPQPMALEFLLRRHLATGERRLLDVAEQTLVKMAGGGVYDQLGGGFHRYSVDAHWLVPHFEKMLYDNSQLARVYLHAWQISGRPLFRRVAEETLDFVRRELTHADGGFYCTLDADAEGEEGKFYVWSADELRAVLGAPASAFGDAYGVTPAGNFDGRNILHVARDLDVVAYRQSLSVAEVEATLAAGRTALLRQRATRVRPGLDDKVLTGWNGLMLAAFAEAARALARADYRATAEANADFLLRALTRDGARLHRTWRAGRATLNGFLEDYACLIEGLLELYQTTFEERWFQAARALADAMLARFADPAGGFFDTSDDHEPLVTRPKELQDNAVPSGNAMAATVLLRLHALTGEDRYAAAVAPALALVAKAAPQFPTGFGQWLCAADFALGGAREVAIVGVPGAADTEALVRTALAGYRPRQVVAMGRSERTVVPLLAGRVTRDGRATAYVCRHFKCEMPVTEPAALAAQLA
ncbi:MAG: thioredoxin domain-containing protein [Actinobacteria bacterium]|nr:thioredoxin domain-containing protein [Actinomycetota bacterium]